MSPHPDAKVLARLFPAVRRYQALASKHGIGDIFQDNGGKLLQLVLLAGLKVIPGREGNDARDEQGREYELKSVNLLLTKSFSTHHHLNPVILGKYRKVGWYFALYEGIELQEVYLLSAADLKPYFTAWEAKWNATRRDINNPKIPVKFVREKGRMVFRSTQPAVQVRPSAPTLKPSDPEAAD